MDGGGVASGADQILIQINTLDVFYCPGVSRRSRNLRNGAKAPRFSRKNNPAVTKRSRLVLPSQPPLVGVKRNAAFHESGRPSRRTLQ